MKILGYIFLGVIVFFIGYAVGKTPTTEEQNQKAQAQAYLTDVRTVAADGQTMFNLCEQKYQALFKGDTTTAFTYKGQIDVIQAQITQILSKYQTSGI